MSTIQSAPAQGSILAEILRALRDGERLTSKAALQRFGHSRLALLSISFSEGMPWRSTPG